MGPEKRRGGPLLLRIKAANATPMGSGFNPQTEALQRGTVTDKHPLCHLVKVTEAEMAGRGRAG